MKITKSVVFWIVRVVIFAVIFSTFYTLQREMAIYMGLDSIFEHNDDVTFKDILIGIDAGISIRVLLWVESVVMKKFPGRSEAMDVDSA